MKRLILTLLSGTLLLSSCTVFRYGISSSVMIDSDNKTGDNVDIVVVGTKKIKEHHNVQLPYKLHVKNSNLPVQVSIYSDNRIYDNFILREKETNWGFLERSLYYSFGGCSLFAAAVLDGALAAGGVLDDESVMATLPFVGAGAISILLGALTPKNILDNKSYTATSTPVTSKNSYKLSPEWRRLSERMNVYELMESGYYEVAKTKANYLLKENDCTEMHYLCGVNYYHIGKYKKAIKELNKALELKDHGVFEDDIKNYISAAYEKRSEQIEARNAKWATFAQIAAGTLAQTASALGDAAMNHNIVGTSSPNDMQQYQQYLQQQGALIAQQSLQQTYMQDQAEYQQFAAGYKQMTGKDISHDEYWSMKGQAIMDLKAQGIDPYEYTKGESSLDIETSNSQENKDSSKRDNDEATTTSAERQTKTQLKEEQPSNSNKQSEEVKTPTKQTIEQQNSDKDYRFERNIQTLYIRNGDKAQKALFVNNVPLYRKGATKYLKIGGLYYRVGYSNWGRFNRSIIYGHNSLYFND